MIKIINHHEKGEIISETLRKTGVRVQLSKSRVDNNYIVKDYYLGGVVRSVNIFGLYNSAVNCFNEIVKKENKKGEE